jgi:hypothetical protein
MNSSSFRRKDERIAVVEIAAECPGIDGGEWAHSQPRAATKRL